MGRSMIPMDDDAKIVHNKHFDVYPALELLCWAIYSEANSLGSNHVERIIRWLDGHPERSRWE